MLFESDLPFRQWSTPDPAPDPLMRAIVAIHHERWLNFTALKKRYDALREDMRRYTAAQVQP